MLRKFSSSVLSIICLVALFLSGPAAISAEESNQPTDAEWRLYGFVNGFSQGYTDATMCVAKAHMNAIMGLKDEAIFEQHMTQLKEKHYERARNLQEALQKRSVSQVSIDEILIGFQAGYEEALPPATEDYSLLAPKFAAGGALPQEAIASKRRHRTKAAGFKRASQLGVTSGHTKQILKNSGQ